LRIGELRVNNFRHLRGEHTLKLSKGLNLIHSEGPDNTWITNLTEAIKASLGCYESDQQKSILYTTPDDEIHWGSEVPHCSSEADIIDEDMVYTCSFRASLNEKGERDIHSIVPNSVAALIGKGSIGEVFFGSEELSFIGALEDERSSDPPLLNLRRFLANARRRGLGFAVVEDPGFVYCGESRYDPLVNPGLDQVLFLTNDPGSVEALRNRAQNMITMETSDWVTEVLNQ